MDSSPTEKVDRLQTLQDKAVRVIDNRAHTEMNTALLSNYYRILPLKERRAEHLCVVMHRLSKDDRHLEKARPEIRLRSRNKIKFKSHKRVYENTKMTKPGFRPYASDRSQL